MPHRHTPSLTAELHEAFKSPPSGLSGYTMADRLGKNYQTLMSELSRQPGHKFAADLVLPAMRLTSSDAPLHMLAREMGGAFVRLPGSGCCPPNQQQCLITVKEFSALMQAYAAAILAGKITKAELETIIKEGHQTIGSILALMKLAENECEARP